MSRFQFVPWPVGRHLIDLPAPIEGIERTQRILNVDVTWISANEEQFELALKTRLQEMREAAAQSNLFYQEESGASEKSCIVLYEELGRGGAITYEAFRYAKDFGGYFLLTEDVTRSKMARVKPWVDRILKILLPRDNESIPKGIGACIDHGLVLNTETEFSEVIGLSANLGALVVGFSTQVYDRPSDEATLLDRSHVLTKFPNTSVKRSTKRTVNGQDGHELVFASVAGNSFEPSFSARWECPGKLKSRIAPRISVTFTVHGNPALGGLTSDELMGLWDVVVASIRLRPGSV